ncbi:MAG TPA: class I SAM-dependent methyltransferase [Xanthobacteraceae bacterium]|nr:class I SAM-dependent methyltransferase [Xanthobacteraceae bacterium]
MRFMSLASNFIEINRILCRRLTPAHVHEANVFGVYRKLGTMLLSHPQIHRVLDCGAGKRWHFPSYYKRWYDIHLIGIDIDAHEMETNRDLDEKLVCDVTDQIPVTPECIDLVLASSGVEHFSDNEAFLRNAYGCLRPGGFLLAQFPGRYAPFAIVNRLVPTRLARFLINLSMKNDAIDLGFPAHYDRTHYSAFSALAEKAGFECLYYSPGFYSSSYAEFLLPLWLLSYTYDALRFFIGSKNLASYNLFLLQKPPRAVDPEPLRFHAWP